MCYKMFLFLKWKRWINVSNVGSVGWRVRDMVEHLPSMLTNLVVSVPSHSYTSFHLTKNSNTLEKFLDYQAFY